MSSMLERLFSLVIDFLQKSNQENKGFWEKVRSDTSHCFHFCLASLKDSGSVENQRHVLKEELKSALLQVLKNNQTTQQIALRILRKDENIVKLDLRSSQSSILQCLVDILKINLTVYTSEARAFYFSSCKGLLRLGPPLVIQWSRDKNSFIEVEREYHFSRFISPESFPTSSTKVSFPTDSTSKKKTSSKELSKPVRRKRRYKSPEFVSSSSDSDSSSFSDEDDDDDDVRKRSSRGNAGVIKKKIDKDVPKKRLRLEETREKIDNSVSVSSLAKDLTLTESENEEFEEEAKKLQRQIGVEVPSKNDEFDFTSELKKMQESQSQSTLSKKFDRRNVEVSVSDSAKNLQRFSPSSELYLDTRDKIEANLSKFLEITERMRKHALVMQQNLLPGNIESCLCCPVHCAQALIKATKDKRGPKKKN